ncbi:Exocyst subunit-Sec10p [Phaffia rhodozyma]|uniref:Exocyst subunit-Sec10p n=1 Tax=Phaffia rhodozyma TaxID=264483 RepID=A0A0F7SQH7_PHARH|nr:Exocyst subunit-Sec10p [Phaffia rhodozyma]
MASRFEPDPAIEEVLKVDNFQDQFDIQEFISTLSDKLIANSVQSSAPFTPLPFLQTFSHAVDSLLQVRKEVQARTDKLEAEVSKAEREYGRKLKELDRGFEAVSASFATISNTTSSIGSPAIRIGETLETLHISRSKAQYSSILLSYYIALSNGDSSLLDRLLKDARRDGREGRDGRMRCAVVLRRLASLVKEDSADAGGKTGNRIEEYCEKFEKEVLGLFDKYYRQGDPKMMGHCARVLLEFNGGTSCVQIYVNQHDFFISKDRIGRVGSGNYGHEEATLWQTLPDPFKSSSTTEPTLRSLYDEIRVTVSQEAQIIQAVFPNPPMVMQVFLNRVFAQVIQQILERLLDKAGKISTLATLRILYISHTMTSTLIDDLKAYEFPSASSSGSRSSASDPSAGDSTVGGKAKGADGDGASTAVAVMLENCLEEMFAPFIEGVRYLERESKSLAELYAGFLANFTKYHETVHKAKPNKLFDRVVNQLASASASSSSQTTQAAASAILKYSGVSEKTPGGSVEAELEAGGIKVEDGALKMDVAETMLKWHAEAVGRCVELSSSGEVPKGAFALMRVLAEALGRSYIETALDSTLAKMDAHDPRLEPDLSVLATVRSADLLCHMWQKYSSVALLPLALSSVTIRREMVAYSQTNIGRAEEKINAIMQTLLDLINSWLALQLTKQKKLDFKPKNDDVSFERVNTEPCTLALDVLEKVKVATKSYLSGKNADGFLTEVGVGFHALLLDHLKKFPVSVTGALMLTKDLATYQEAITAFGIPVLNERFAMLRQLGNLFVVQPEVLKTFMAESYLGQIEPRLLRPYLAQRVDYSTFSKRFAEDERFGIDVDAVAAGAADAAIRMRSTLTGQARSLGTKGLNRLSVMIKELDNYAASSSASSSPTGTEGQHVGRSSPISGRASPNPAARGAIPYFSKMPL